MSDTIEKKLMAVLQFIGNVLIFIIVMSVIGAIVSGDAYGFLAGAVFAVIFLISGSIAWILCGPGR